MYTLPSWPIVELLSRFPHLHAAFSFSQMFEGKLHTLWHLPKNTECDVPPQKIGIILYISTVHLGSFFGKFRYWCNTYVHYIPGLSVTCMSLVTYHHFQSSVDLEIVFWFLYFCVLNLTFPWAFMLLALTPCSRLILYPTFPSQGINCLSEGLWRTAPCLLRRLSHVK